MTYQAQHDLAQDPDFNGRVQAAVVSESRGKISDPLAAMVMNSPGLGVMAFMPFIATAPGLADKYSTGTQTAVTDGDILSAVQAVWLDVATVRRVP